MRVMKALIKSLDCRFRIRKMKLNETEDDFDKVRQYKYHTPIFTFSSNSFFGKRETNNQD